MGKKTVKVNGTARSAPNMLGKDTADQSNSAVSKVEPKKVDKSKRSDSNDIDNIFATRTKRPKLAAPETVAIVDSIEKQSPAKNNSTTRGNIPSVNKRNILHNQDGIRKTDARKNVKPGDIKPIRYDAGLGMRIFTEESLGIGRGGGTKDCPFDCNCCF